MTKLFSNRIKESAPDNYKMQCRRNCGGILVFCFMSLCHFWGAQVLVGSEVDPQVALEVVKSLEKEVTSLRWNGTYVSGSLKKEAMDDEPYFFCVFFEPSSKRHCVGVKVRPPLSDSCLVKFFSFDGNLYESLEDFGPCEEGIIVKKGDGAIYHEHGESVPHVQFWHDSGTPTIGVSSGVPGICDFMPLPRPELLSVLLSEWIKNKQLISIVETEKGVWVIVSKVTIWTLPGENNPRTRIELRYDIEKGGVITEQKIIAQQLDQQSRKIVDVTVKNWKITHVLNPKNQWVPKTIYKMDQTTLRYFKIDYDEFEINPSIDEDTFRIAFPDGVYIDDFIAKKRYKVGNPVDEDQAIEDFIRHHGLTGNVPEQTWRKNALRYVFMGIGVVLIAIALYLMIQRWRKD